MLKSNTTNNVTKSVVVILAIFLTTTISFAQPSPYRDLLWPFGYGDERSAQFGISALDFRGESIDTLYLMPGMGVSLGQGAGSFSANMNNDIILYADGCRIYDGELNVLSGTDYLFPSQLSDDFCFPTADYPAIQAAINLPGDNYDSTIYCLSGNVENFSVSPYVGSTAIGVWRMGKQSDGSYELEEVTKMETETREVGRFAACRKPGTWQWWVPSIGGPQSNMKVYAIGGEEDIAVHSLFPLPEPVEYMGLQAAFSPNSQRYAFGAGTKTVWLFDFDNEEGDLSNLRRIDLPNESIYMKGICFSPDSELLYITADTCLYQIEVATETIRLIDCHRSFSETGWPVNIGSMLMGPDCRIYISPSSSTWYLHTIHQPNLIGVDCQFQPRAVRTPTRVDFSLMNMPLYRDGTDCIEIGWPFQDPTPAEDLPAAPPEIAYLTAAPNPARADIQLRWQTTPPPSAELLLYLYNTRGREIRRLPLAPGTANQLSRRSLPSGVYSWALSLDGFRVQTGQVVWQ